MNEKKPNWLFNSRAYLKAAASVKKTLKSPKSLRQLVTKAQHKADGKSGKLSALSDSLGAVMRLLKCYASGEYRDISFESLALVVASIIYFVMPIDVLPDFIIGLGLIDDISLLAWTFNSVKEDIQRFLEWEKIDGANVNEADHKIVNETDSESL